MSCVAVSCNLLTLQHRVFALALCCHGGMSTLPDVHARARTCDSISLAIESRKEQIECRSRQQEIESAARGGAGSKNASGENALSAGGTGVAAAAAAAATTSAATISTLVCITARTTSNPSCPARRWARSPVVPVLPASASWPGLVSPQPPLYTCTWSVWVSLPSPCMQTDRNYCCLYGCLSNGHPGKVGVRGTRQRVPPSGP